MDRNLYLLKSEQIKLLQDICTRDYYKHILEGFTCFHEIRNQVDVVILDDNTGYGEYYKTIEEDEKSIRKAIEEELRRREGINIDEETREERPHLPNYDHPEDYNPSIFDWEDNDSDLDYGYFSAGDDENWLRTKNHISRLQQHQRSPNRYEYSYKINGLLSIKDVDNTHLQFMSDDSELVYTYGLSNDQLRLLDDRLGRLKWNRYRLNRAIDNRKSGNVTYWSGTMLGCFCIERNPEGKIKSKTIYLFIDSIRDHARTHPLNTASYTVSEDSIVAQVFIHEMFHAYYHVNSKDFISTFLKGIVYIEEAMTEYAMLNFLDEYDTNHYKVALYDVEDKLNSHDPTLQYYGLGAYLHKVWFKKCLFKDKLLKIFQTIQPAPRLSIRLVRAFVANVRSRSRFSASLSMRYLYDIIDYFRTFIRSTSDNYCFRGQNYGCTNHLVYAVLQYYKSYTKCSLAQMQSDFDYANTNLYGSKPLFLELSAIPADQVNIDYDLTQKFTLEDGSGIEVVPLRKWANKINGSAMKFLVKVSHLHRRGIINEPVRILR